MPEEMSDEEYGRLKRSMGAGMTLTQAKAVVFARRYREEREARSLLAASSLGSPEVRAVVAEGKKEPMGMQFFKEELEELLAVAAPTPAQLRRIAEVAAIVHDDAAARPWWERAAAAGDEDAQGHLEELRAEE